MNTATPLTPPDQQALDRLLALALNDDSDGRKVRAFLLAWWNADAFGGFDPSDLAGVPRIVSQDMLTVLRLIACDPLCYPEALPQAPQFVQLVDLWQAGEAT